MFSFIEHGAVIRSSGPLYALPQFMRRSGGRSLSPLQTARAAHVIMVDGQSRVRISPGNVEWVVTKRVASATYESTFFAYSKNGRVAQVARPGGVMVEVQCPVGREWTTRMTWSAD
jgi:hypothetical protein